MTSEAQSLSKREAESLIPRFKFERLLNQGMIDYQAGRRVSLFGQIDEKPAIMIAERAAFSAEDAHLRTFSQSVDHIQNLGANDIYNWFLASTSNPPVNSDGATVVQPPDLKLNLIYPCTAQHIAKYSAQGVRIVTETPTIYRDHIRPFMQEKRDAGRLNWVFNIIEGRTEQEDVIFREHSSKSSDNEDEGFLLLPDLNWDRKTIASLHLLGLVERRDIWSVRDLSKTHVPWLKTMRAKMLESTTKLFPQVEADQLKLYVHYQPTYYHFHVHVVHVMLEAGATQATGKALGLDNIIGQLEAMDREDASMQDVSLSYTVGEASELWQKIYEPLKNGTLNVSAAS